MEFHLPATIEDARALLREGDDAMCLAGGATLVAMMTAELVEPTALISLRKIPELTGITRTDDGRVRIGAMTTHHDVATDPSFADGQRIVPLAAARIGHPAVRNMGTIGGAICHADPAADYPAALVAAEAEIEIVGDGGRRAIPADGFFTDYFETATGAGEIVTAVSLPPAPPGTVAVYEKFSRVDGDFATVSAAVVLGLVDDSCSYARIAVGSCGPTPVRIADAETRLVGTTLDEGVLADCGRMLSAACDPIDDVRGSAAYRLKLVPRLVARAVCAARAEALGR